MNSNYLKSLRIIYFALAMGIALFLLVTIVLTYSNGPLTKDSITALQRAPFLIALIVLTGTSFLLNKVIFTKKLEAIKALPTLDIKLIAWRELCVLQGALIEAPAFFALVLFLLLGVYTLMVWPLAAFVLFWMRQPTRERLISEANLSPAEVAEFDKMQ